MSKKNIGNLSVNLGLNNKDFTKGLSDTQKSLRIVQRRIKDIGEDMKGIGQRMSVAVTAPLVALGYKSTAAFAEQEKSIAAVDAVLASMGQTAGFTSEELQDMASELQSGTLYGDEDILGRVTANLLTFGEVQGEVFARAQTVALDMSARLGQDVQSSAVMLGKALNDPAAGLTALSRVGVSFTEQQKEQIKAMADVGDVAGAQSLMLAELERQYAGQAAALAELDSGKVTQSMNTIGDAMEVVGAIIMPIVADIAVAAASVAAKFQELSPPMQKFIVVVGAIAAAIGPVVFVLGAAVIAFSALLPVIAAISLPVVAVVAAFAALAAGAFIIGMKVGEAVNAVGGFGEAMASVARLGSEVWGRIGLGVDALGFRVKSVFLGISSSIAASFHSGIERAYEFGNTIAAVFRGAFDGIKATWKQLPLVLGEAMVGAVNKIIGAYEGLLSKFTSGIDGLSKKINEAFGTSIGLLGDVNLGRVANPFAGAGEAAGDAFKSSFATAMGEDFLGGAPTGLADFSADAEGAAAVYSDLATSMSGLVTEPLKEVQAFKDALRDAADVEKASIDEASEGAQALSKIVIDTNDEVDDLGDGITGLGNGSSSAATGVDELNDSLDKVPSLAKRVGEAFAGAFDQIKAGNISGGISGLFSDLKSEGVTAFSDLVDTAFSEDGFDFSKITSGIGDAFTGAFDGIKTAFSGGGLASVFGGVSSAVTSFLPAIGAISSVVSLIKGFSSKTVVGSGLDLGIEGGEVAGGTFETIKKKTFWGLFSSTRTSLKSFSSEMSEALNDQMVSVQDAVRDAYEVADVAVSDAMIEGVDLAVDRIDTRGMSEAEIEEAVTDVFASYGDALSEAIGGVSFELAANFANVKSVVEAAGGMFYGAFDVMADAAFELTELFGGNSALASSVGSFVDAFFTETEKFDLLSGQVSDVFADLGIAIPDTASEFKELVLAQDLMTEAGREVYQALLDIAPTFDEISASVSDLSSSFSDGSSQYQTDFDARLAQVAEARGYTVEQSVYSDGGSQINGQLGALLAATGNAATVSQRMVEILERQEIYGVSLSPDTIKSIGKVVV